MTQKGAGARSCNQALAPSLGRPPRPHSPQPDSETKGHSQVLSPECWQSPLDYLVTGPRSCTSRVSHARRSCFLAHTALQTSTAATRGLGRGQAREWTSKQVISKTGELCPGHMGHLYRGLHLAHLSPKRARMSDGGRGASTHKLDSLGSRALGNPWALPCLPKSICYPLRLPLVHPV